MVVLTERLKTKKKQELDCKIYIPLEKVVTATLQAVNFHCYCKCVSEPETFLSIQRQYHHHHKDQALRVSKDKGQQSLQVG